MALPHNTLLHPHIANSTSLNGKTRHVFYWFFPTPSTFFAELEQVDVSRSAQVAFQKNVTVLRGQHNRGVMWVSDRRNGRHVIRVEWHGERRYDNVRFRRLLFASELGTGPADQSLVMHQGSTYREETEAKSEKSTMDRQDIIDSSCYDISINFNEPQVETHRRQESHDV